MIEIQLLHPAAKVPSRGSRDAAGFDLHSIEDVRLEPGERAAIGTGLAFKIPQQWYGKIEPRSGLAMKHGIDTLAGIIDSDYRGEVKVILIHLGGGVVDIKKGDRIAQLVVQNHGAWMPLMVVNELDDTDRGADGFGSTGK
jgi:dUTP pyrophosphatase